MNELNEQQIYKTWTLIDKSNGLSNIVNDNLDLEKIEISYDTNYDYKFIGKEHTYHLNIIDMDFKYKMIYANIRPDKNE